MELETACVVRRIVSDYTGDPKYVSGSEEDAQEFLMQMVNTLGAELEGNEGGISALNKLWGTTLTTRKFEPSR